MKEVLVDILCLAYNHEKYIRKTLEGFVNQKTNFKYRVLINDDASTDHTADIIREYEEKYPDIFFPIYQTENQHSKKIGNLSTHLAPKVTAKYVAFCEGDDYWLDENKLQMQVDALEKHSDCHMCVHTTGVIAEDGSVLDQFIPKKDKQLKEGVLDSKEFIALKWSFQLSSYLIKSEYYLPFIKNPPAFKKACPVGDGAILLYFGQLGNVYYIDRVMSHYRKGVPHSWSSQQKGKEFVARQLKHARGMFNTYVKFNEYTNDMYKDCLYSRMVTLLFKYLILDKNAKAYLNDEYKEYYRSLPLKKKLYVVFAMVFPSLANTLYCKEIRKGK